MELDWGYFRGLYLELTELDEHQDLLRSQQGTAAEHLADLTPLGKRVPLTEELTMQSMKLYALSRISDYLIERYCHDNATVHEEFLTAIGLTPFTHAGFSPFHHEIAAVTQDEAATEVTVEETLWPGFWFGDLLFSRAGVRVRAPKHLIDAEIATTSTLYFTFRRYPRRTDDLSHGWGSNSQWRTKFERFYADDEGLHFNWDGSIDLGEEGHEQLEQRREVLLHRCFVRGPLPPDEHDQYPYQDRLSL